MPLAWPAYVALDRSAGQERGRFARTQDHSIAVARDTVYSIRSLREASAREDAVEWELVADTVEGPRWTWSLGEHRSYELPELVPAHGRLYLIEPAGRPLVSGSLVTCLA